MPRTFNGTSDLINLSLGALNFLAGDLTVAAIVKRSANGNADTILQSGVATSGTNRWQFQIANTDVFRLILGANTSPSITTVTSSDGWVFIAGAHATGTTTPRYHIFKYSTRTWTHEDAAGTIVNGGTPATSAVLAANPIPGAWFHGDIEMVGAWNATFSDQQIEAMAFGIGGWLQKQPKGLWRLDQAATGTNVIDMSGTHADQSGINGTTIGTASSPFNCGVGPRSRV